MNTFSELGLNAELAKAVSELGFEQPTPIQSQAIPILLTGTQDFVGLAQTGTGKTAAFGLPLMQLTGRENHPQALIICPTRELCMQINEDLQEYKKFSPHIRTIAVYGGTSISTQISSIRRGVNIVTATPGRLIDLIERKAIDLNKVKYLVLDEADEMLNMGFRDDIDFILENTPNRESVWLFSATMPNEVRSIANKFMTSPAEVTIGRKNMANADIEHQYVVTAAHHRYEALKRLIDFHPDIYGIIFSRTKAGAQMVADRLNSQGYEVEALHGDLSQQQRDRVMNRFRQKNTQLLVATDVAARGIDVEGITHVINFELPDDPEVYTHRSGRTGRAGNKGLCLSVCHSREIHRIRQIENLIKQPLKKVSIPGAEDVRRSRFQSFMQRLKSANLSDSRIDSYIDEAAAEFENYTREDLLRKIAALELEQIFKYYQGSEDLNVTKRENSVAGRKSFGEKNGKRRNGYRRLFINLGTRDGFYKANLLQYILDESQLKKDSIGKIDLKDINTWVEVENADAPRMMKKLNGKKYKGRMIRMNEA